VLITVPPIFIFGAQPLRNLEKDIEIGFWLAERVRIGMRTIEVRGVVFGSTRDALA